jgi:hypothetical protein
MEPCPHCGKSVACVVTAAQMWPDDPEASDSSYAVFCDAQRPRGPGGCGASGGFFPTEAEAIAAWNRRASPDEHLLRQAAEALQHLLDDTQHKTHPDCEEGPCPVREARVVAAALRQRIGESNK